MSRSGHSAASLASWSGSATTWGDEDFDAVEPSLNVKDFRSSSSTVEFAIGLQPGGGMGSFLIESKSISGNDFLNRNESSFEFASAPVVAQSVAFGAPKLRETRSNKLWELNEDEDRLRIGGSRSKKNPPNDERRVRPDISSRRPQKRKIEFKDASQMQFEARSSRIAPLRLTPSQAAESSSSSSSNAAAPVLKKAKKVVRVAKDAWKPDMLDMTDEDVVHLTDRLKEDKPKRIFIIEADTLEKHKITPFVRTLLFSPNLPEGMLLLVAKSQYFSPCCSTCGVSFPGKMRETPQRLLLRKPDQQPAGMCPGEFYSHALNKFIKSFPGYLDRLQSVELAILTGDKQSSFKWSSGLRSAQFKPVLVDISGNEEMVGQCPKSFPADGIPAMNTVASEFLAKHRSDFELPEDSSSAMMVDFVNPEEKMLPYAVERVRAWLRGRLEEGSLPQTRSALANSIAKSACKVKYVSEPGPILQIMVKEDLARLCTTCGNLVVKKGEEIAPFVPRDKWEAIQRYGEANYMAVTKLFTYLLSPKASIPTTAAGLHNLVNDCCTSFVTVPSSKVVEKLYALQMIAEQSSLDHASGAAAYVQQDSGKSRLEYNWDAIMNLEPLVSAEELRRLSRSSDAMVE